MGERYQRDIDNAMADKEKDRQTIVDMTTYNVLMLVCFYRMARGISGELRFH